MAQQKESLIGKLNNAVVKVYPELQEKKVTPKTIIQEVEPDEGTYGLSKVIVDKVTNEIDENIISANIKAGINILGVSGNLEPDKPDQEKVITPTTKEQEVTADIGYELAKVIVKGIEVESKNVKSTETSQMVEPTEGKFINKIIVEPLVLDSIEITPTTEKQELTSENDGIKQVNVNAVTKDIDVNIIPTNIKKGVIILGVEGNVEEGINTDDATATAEDISEGKTAYANGEKLIGTNTYNAKMNTINYGTSFQIVKEILEVPLISITSVTNMQEAFSKCERITTIPLFDTNKVTNMSSAFSYCYNLENIPQLNTGKVQNFSSMFSYCRNLESLPELNFESAINVSNFFAQVFNVINLGGFDNLGKAYIEKTINYARYALNLSSCEKLTHDSIMNVINNLYDLNLNENLSVDGVCQYTQSLNLGATNLAKLTDEEKAIAVNKGWTLS